VSIPFFGFWTNGLYGKNYIATEENSKKRKLHKIDTESFRLDKSFEPVWIYTDSLGTRFYQNESDFIQYFAEDLIGSE
jgi:hypothetical protein